MKDPGNIQQNAGGLIISVPFNITSADIDMNARLRMGSLANLLIQSAINSADNLEAGYESIRQQKLFWVLSRLTIEIDRSLTWYQSGEVETWPKLIEKILYIRDFIVRDQDLTVAARATSGWLAVDLDTKRPRNVEGGQSSLFNKLKDKHALNISPEKLFPVKEGEFSELKSTFFDIDVNGHVTSTRYVDWMMDSFPVEFHKNNYPRMFSINYLSETRPGETIQLSKNTPDGKTFTFEGFNKNRKVFAFRGKIVF